MTAPQVFFCLLLAACLYAAWSDLFRRRLPNWLCLLVLGLGLIEALWTGGFYLSGNHVLHAVIALVVGMVLTRVGVIGAGDAKFYTACAAWFSLAQALALLLWVSLCGLALFVGWFAWRRIKRLPMRNRTNSHFDSLPYGIAIAAGAVVANWLLLNGALG